MIFDLRSWRRRFLPWMLLGATTMMVVLALTWFAFALASGAESEGGGWSGFIANAPNALPWLGLFALIGVAFRWERLGGLLIAAAGLASVFFFEAREARVVLFGASLPMILIGVILATLGERDR